MNERLQKLTGIVLVVALCMVGLLACLERAGLWRTEARSAQSVQALESFDSRLAFATTYHYGEIRHFAGTGVGLSMTCHTQGNEAAEDTFVIELHRMVFGLFDVQVGSVTVSREGPVYLTWDNAGSGDFFLRFVKAPDSQAIVSEDVNVFSFEAE